MEVALCTLFSLFILFALFTLFTLLTLFKTVFNVDTLNLQIVAIIYYSIYAHIYC